MSSGLKTQTPPPSDNVSKREYLASCMIARLTHTAIGRTEGAELPVLIPPDSMQSVNISRSKTYSLAEKSDLTNRGIGNCGLVNPSSDSVRS